MKKSNVYRTYKKLVEKRLEEKLTDICYAKPVPFIKNIWRGK